MNTLHFVEFNLIKNCNLNCKGCNHFSTLTKKEEIMSISSLSNDLNRLKELDITVERISLLGGEPLLLNNLEDYIIECKKIYPNSKVELTTNGLLICKMSDKFLYTLKKYDVKLLISLYPLKTKNKLKKQITLFLNKNQINYEILIFKNIFRKQLSLTTHTEELKKYCWCPSVTCENGKLYCCPVSAFIQKLNREYNYTFPENEYIDLYSPDVDIDKICNMDNSIIELCKYCSPKDISTFKWEGYYSNKASRK